MSKRTQSLNLIFGAAALAASLLVVPLLYKFDVVGIEFVNQLGRYMCFVIVALGVDLVWGYTGILSLCQAMFFTLGAYAMGMHLALHGPLDGDHNDIPRCLFVVSSDVSGMRLPWFWQPFQTLPGAIILGMALPGLLGFLFGYLTFRSRVRGVYFSIVTQATTLAAWNVFCLNNMRLCGTNGLTNFDTVAGIDLHKPSGKLAMYFASVLTTILVYLFCRHFVKSRAGRVSIAVRDNESRLRFSGYQPVFFKVFVFAVAAAIAGIAGMLYSPQMGIITPSNMGVTESIIMVVWVAVGGRGTLSGAFIGALFMNYLYSFTTSTYVLGGITLWKPPYWPFVLGGVAIAVVLFLPEGLIGVWQRLISEGEDERAGAPIDNVVVEHASTPAASVHEEARA